MDFMSFMEIERMGWVRGRIIPLRLLRLLDKLAPQNEEKLQYQTSCWERLLMSALVTYIEQITQVTNKLVESLKFDLLSFPRNLAGQNPLI